ncbi:MAG: response regulator [Candidatus Methanoperedens sp.]|nr:response regulator [Candidatus Methanoperedens sp.]
MFYTAVQHKPIFGQMHLNCLWGWLAVLISSSTEADEEATQPAPALKPTVRATTANILIVEDESIVALDIKMTLRRMGHHVIATVDSGHDAIIVAVRDKPDLILMDIRLKGDIDGISASHAINQQCQIPIIYLTGQLDESTVKRAQSTHPTGYLAKPFAVADLAALIDQALERKNSR